MRLVKCDKCGEKGTIQVSIYTYPIIEGPGNRCSGVQLGNNIDLCKPCYDEIIIPLIKKDK
jgi:hypothetical protein